MRNKKLILCACITIIIIICCIIIITPKKDNNTNTVTIQNSASNEITINQVKDINTIFNIRECINKTIEDIYYKAETTTYYQLCDTHFSIWNSMENYGKFDEFYINSLYKADLIDNISVYFAKGYITIKNKTNINIEKHDMSITVVCDKNNNKCGIELYGTTYKEYFNYNDDITKTTVSNYAESKGIDVQNLPKDFSYSDLTNDISDEDLIIYYYKDYIINNDNNNKDTLKSISIYDYSGSIKEGFTFEDANENKYFLKLLDNPIEYEMKVN